MRSAKPAAILLFVLAITAGAWILTRSGESPPAASLTNSEVGLDLSQFPRLGDPSPPGVADVNELMYRRDSELVVLDGLRKDSYNEIDLPSRGRLELTQMSDAQFEEYYDELFEIWLDVRRENRRSAQAFLEEYRRAWPQKECPTDKPVDRALFDTSLADTLGLDSFDQIASFELSHVADIALPDGTVHLSTASFAEVWSVDLGAPGVHPLYMATAEWRDTEYVNFAQLVVADGVPARWVEDDRLYLDAEYRDVWIAGANAHLDATFDHSDLIESLAFWDYYTIEVYDESDASGALCSQWAHADGRNLVRQSASYDGAFPAYVAYDDEGRLLAVTWDFSFAPIEEPPTPPPAGVEQLTPDDPQAPGQRGPNGDELAAPRPQLTTSSPHLSG